MSISSHHVTVRTAIALFLVATPTASAKAQRMEMRTVIATDVACRARPETSAPVLTRFSIGELVVGREQAQSTDGTWYRESSRVREPGCWVFGGMTADATNREATLLAAADRILARTDTVPFLDFVAVDNLLRQTTVDIYSDSTILERSPRVQLRRLQVLERAVDAPGISRTRVQRDPLMSAWFFNYRDVLRYHEPGGGWILPPEIGWRLYDQYRSTSSADEIAWFAAQGSLGGDECDAACIFDGLNRGYARYWEAFPNGRWIDEALTRAAQRTVHAVGTACMYASPETTRASAARIRASLARVAAAGRDTILGHVGEAERRCRPGASVTP